VRALLRANRYIINNPKGAIKILSDWGRTKPDIAEDAYNDNAKNYSRNLLVSKTTLENVIESTRLNVESKKNVAVDEIFDFSLVREVLKEMGESPS
jgi:ABC-type nitrate/sulfonate/bicarbonate transport system substrate-binding protein